MNGTKTEQLNKSAARPWAAAAIWMLFLGLFFFLVWGICDWITSMRPDVGTFYFEWERRIPFVPLMIIPYVSMDLFFAGSTFLCRSRRELHSLVKRIVFAILISAVGFLLFPLRLGFVRPDMTGSFRSAFDLLEFSIGKHNLFPSLHISLRWIIWDVYRRHTTGFLRYAIGGWFVLIALSTILAYQHQVIDVLGGDIVAILSFYAFPQCGPPVKRRPPQGMQLHSRVPAELPNKNLRVGSIYATFSLMLLLFGYAARPWGIILAWPAVALAILASAYFGFGSAVFRKSRGRLPFSATALLAPYLLGAHLSSLYYRRSGEPYIEVAPGIVLGRKLNQQESVEAVRQGVTAVLDLTAEYPESDPFLVLPYKNIQILDLTTPTVDQLDEAVEFLRQHARGSKVYVHCALGYSRSACVVAAYLLVERKVLTVDEAVTTIRKMRPQSVLKTDLISVLRAYHATLG